MKDSMGRIPKPHERKRAHRKMGPTLATRGIYKLFIKPFLNNYTLVEGQTFKDGIDAFFNVSQRPVLWCRALDAFKIPGVMWESSSQPYRRIDGTGNRMVAKGDSFILRQDLTVADKHEIEFKEQHFVLTDAQYEVIKDKIKAIV